MTTITITIPEEIRQRLKKESNQSGLISRLLNEYFGKDDNPEILKLKREKLINDMNSKIKIMDHEIEVREKDIKVAQLSEKEIISKRASKIENTIKSAKDFFSKKITKGQAEDYLDGNYDDLKQYLGIEDLPDEN